jgi:hypothetical protein
VEYFLGDDLKLFEVGDTKRGGDGHIRRVTASRHQNTPGSSLIVTGVKRPPAIF